MYPLNIYEYNHRRRNMNNWYVYITFVKTELSLMHILLLIESSKRFTIK